ncbi:hypothetical protein QQ045_005056 [Rhodiola kirilowii]
MEIISSPETRDRRSAGPVLIRSECLETKFGFKSSKFTPSSFTSMASAGVCQRSSSSPPSVGMSTSSNRFRSAVRSPKKNTCMCSPTTHPGSFRCSIHKRVNNIGGGGAGSISSPYISNRLYARRSAVTNSLMRLGTVEGYFVKRALAALIRPSSHQQRRSSGFQPRPTRLSVMSTADEAA